MMPSGRSWPPLAWKTNGGRRSQGMVAEIVAGSSAAAERVV